MKMKKWIAGALTAALLREYEVDEETARKCAADFTEKLLDAGCLE